MNKIFFWLIIALGILIVFWGVKELLSKWKLFQKGIPTEATIIDFAVRYSRGAYYAPILTFVLPEGEEVKVEIKDFYSQGTYQKGQKVSIIYFLTDPIQASIKDFKSLWVMPLMILGVGALVIIIGFFLIMKAQ